MTPSSTAQWIWLWDRQVAGKQERETIERSENAMAMCAAYEGRSNASTHGICDCKTCMVRPEYQAKFGGCSVTGERYTSAIQALRQLPGDADQEASNAESLFAFNCVTEGAEGDAAELGATFEEKVAERSICWTCWFPEGSGDRWLIHPQHQPGRGRKDRG